MKRIISVLMVAIIICNTISMFKPAKAYSADEQRVSDSEWTLVLLTNKERLKGGMLPFTTFTNLNNAADLRAQEILTDFSHTRPNGENFNTVLDSCGVSYGYAGENISAGQATPKAACAGFENSSGHRANVMNNNYSHMGVGYYECRSDYWYYWTELFTGQSTYSKIWVEKKNNVEFNSGVSFDEIEAAQAYVIAACTTTGNVCYMPLMKELCCGYDQSVSGIQTITVKVFGLETSFDIEFICEEYNVTYVDWDDTVIMSETVAYGSSAVPPQAPTRANFEFKCWSHDGKNIKSDTVIKAIYEPNFNVGDANADGKVNTSDAVSILRACANNDLMKELSLLEADSNFDNIINTADAVEILILCLK